MGGLTFKGGVHPYEGKELSKDKPIVRFMPKGDMVFPLSQHIGAPAKPVVAKGDRVLCGQLIAEAGGFVSANIYSSVSGTVKSIGKHRVATGDMVESIIIENDEMYEAAEPLPVKDISDMTKQDVIDALPVVIKALGTYDITTIRASIGMYLLCKAIHERTDIRVILTGEISDELFGYKYTDYAPSAEAFQEEARKRLRELHM